MQWQDKHIDSTFTIARHVQSNIILHILLKIVLRATINENKLMPTKLFCYAISDLCGSFQYSYIALSQFIAISRDERAASLKKYDIERQRIRDSVAFGRRADDPIILQDTIKNFHYNSLCKCMLALFRSVL